MKAMALATMLVGLQGCAINVPEELVPEGLEPGKGFAIEAVGAWTDAERAELQGACDEWRAATNGRIDCRVVPEGAGGMARFVRGWDGAGDGTYSTIEFKARTARFDVDGMARAGLSLRAGLGATSRNAIGVAARIGDHPEPGIMSSVAVTPEWTEADAASCRAAGFCS